jgi:hypothetical protein
MSDDRTATREGLTPVVAAAALYFAVVFGIGFALGTIRVFWLEPVLGQTLAVLFEAPLLLIAMVWAARWVPEYVHMRANVHSLAAIGIGALILQQIVDFSVGVGLRGIGPSEQLRYLTTPAGAIYGICLLAFAVMPLLVNRRT